MTDVKQRSEELSGQLKTVFESRLLSVCLYGSAIKDESKDSLKNTNVLAIIRDFKTADLEQVASISQRWEKQARALPMFLSEEEWLNASDVFALEYADIKDNHLLVYGQDFFSTIEIDTQSIRLLCELEIYKKLIFLRQRLLLFKDKPDYLANYMKESIGSFSDLFRGLLRIYQPNQTGLITTSTLYMCIEKQIQGFSSQPFLQIIEMGEKKQKPDKASLLPLFKSYIEQISLVNQFINSFNQL